MSRSARDRANVWVKAAEGRTGTVADLCLSAFEAGFSEGQAASVFHDDARETLVARLANLGDRASDVGDALVALSKGEVPKEWRKS